MLRAFKIGEQSEDDGDQSSSAQRPQTVWPGWGQGFEASHDEGGRGPVAPAREVDAGVVADLLHEPRVEAGSAGALMVEDRPQQRLQQPAGGEVALGLQRGEPLQTFRFEHALSYLDDGGDELFAGAEVVSDRGAVSLSRCRHNLAQRHRGTLFGDEPFGGVDERHAGGFLAALLHVAESTTNVLQS